MQKQEITEVARIVAVEVLNQRENVIQEEFDSRYHDVKLLMKNYRMLKAHYAQVSPDELEVNAICSMHRKTSLMMSHVDKMLTAYKALCYESGRLEEKNRWEALYLRYIADERIIIDEIAGKLNIDRRTFSVTSVTQWRTWLFCYSELKPSAHVDLRRLPSEV